MVSYSADKSRYFINLDKIVDIQGNDLETGVNIYGYPMMDTLEVNEAWFQSEIEIIKRIINESYDLYKISDNIYQLYRKNCKYRFLEILQTLALLSIFLILGTTIVLYMVFEDHITRLCITFGAVISVFSIIFLMIFLYSRAKHYAKLIQQRDDFRVLKNHSITLIKLNKNIQANMNILDKTRIELQDLKNIALKQDQLPEFIQDSIDLRRYQELITNSF